MKAATRLTVISLCLGAFFVTGCASSEFKRRRAERDKVSATSRLYCDFVNGEVYPDVEVQLNLEMAKKCEAEKPMTITNYKTPSENIGVVFCCTMKVATETTETMSTPAAPEKK